MPEEFVWDVLGISKEEHDRIVEESLKEIFRIMRNETNAFKISEEFREWINVEDETVQIIRGIVAVRTLKELFDIGYRFGILLMEIDSVYHTLRESRDGIETMQWFVKFEEERRDESIGNRELRKL